MPLCLRVSEILFVAHMAVHIADLVLTCFWDFICSPYGCAYSWFGAYVFLYQTPSKTKYLVLFVHFVGTKFASLHSVPCLFFSTRTRPNTGWFYILKIKKEIAWFFLYFHMASIIEKIWLQVLHCKELRRLVRKWTVLLGVNEEKCAKI